MDPRDDVRGRERAPRLGYPLAPRRGVRAVAVETKVRASARGSPASSGVHVETSAWSASGRRGTGRPSPEARARTAHTRAPTAQACRPVRARAEHGACTAGAAGIRPGRPGGHMHAPDLGGCRRRATIAAAPATGGGRSGGVGWLRRLAMPASQGGAAPRHAPRTTPRGWRADGRVRPPADRRFDGPPADPAERRRRSGGGVRRNVCAPVPAAARHGAVSARPDRSVHRNPAPDGVFPPRPIRGQWG